MATKTLGACTACRARKVRCIPNTPRCIRCTDLGIEDCRYGSVKKRGIGITLRMGQACVPCRRRKAKCDAKTPCTACLNWDRGVGCRYEPRKRSRFTRINATSISRENTPGPTSSNNLPPKTSADGLSEPLINPTSGRLLTRSDSSESALSLSLSLVPYSEQSSTPTERHPRDLSTHLYDETVSYISSDVSVVQKHPGTTKCAPRLAVSSFTILPSIHFRIPRPLQIPLSLIPPEHVQVSYIAGNDLDMFFRLRTLCRINKLGLYFGMEKQRALFRGDTSNAVVHRHFTYTFQALGMYFCGPPGESPIMLRLLAKYSQLAWETLVEVQETGDKRLIAQALIMLVHGLIIIGFTGSAPLYLLKLCELINNANLQFLPVYGRPPELSDQVREEVTVLSQAIYLENYCYLAMGGAVPTGTARIEREFRLDLEREYPHLFNICPLIMRTQGILLVREATFVLNSHSADQAERANSRQESRHRLVLAMDKFSNDMMGNLQQFIELEDPSGVGTIWTCCITCLGHLAALSHLIGQTELTLRGSMDKVCNLALDRLGNLSHEAHIEEFTHFDALTGFSWKRALDTIDERIRSCPQTERKSLGHWKRVIGKAYADFQVNPFGYGPSQFTSLAISMDGRTEDSSFPNLLEYKERERYGL